MKEKICQISSFIYSEPIFHITKAAIIVISYLKLLQKFID